MYKFSLFSALKLGDFPPPSSTQAPVRTVEFLGYHAQRSYPYACRPERRGARSGGGFKRFHDLPVILGVRLAGPPIMLVDQVLIKCFPLFQTSALAHSDITGWRDYEGTCPVFTHLIFFNSLARVLIFASWPILGRNRNITSCYTSTHA